MKRFEGELVIDLNVIRDTDAERFSEIVAGLAMDYLDTIGATFVETVQEITEATGMTIDAGGRPLSWDLILDGLEQKEIAFDSDGRISGETIIMNPRTAQALTETQMTPEQEMRLNDILQRKKDDWNAQQRSRRLPRRSQGTRV